MTNNVYQNGMPLWPSIDEIPTLYPWLSQKERCQVLILGGGITGAFTALRFAKAGVDTIVLSADPIGFGSTAACQGILWGDAALPETHAPEEWDGEGFDRLNQRCARALDEISSLVEQESISCGFSRLDSLLVAQSQAGAERLKKKYLEQKRLENDISFLLPQTHQDFVSFDFEAAMLGKNQAASCDPFQLTHGLILAAQKAGARIYEHTAAECIRRENGAYLVTTGAGQTVTAGTLILAIGAECAKFLPGCGWLRTSFCLATEPAEILAGWPEKTAIRTEGRTSAQYSITPDGRIFATGLQTGLIDREGKLAGIIPLPSLYEKKFSQLEGVLHAMFPGVRGAKTAYTFSSLSLESEDGLPLLGELKEYPSCYCAVCGGMNGIVYSHIASNMLFDLHEGKKPSLLPLFDPYR